MNKFFVLIVTTFFYLNINAQLINSFNNSKSFYQPTPVEIVDDYIKSGSMAATLNFEKNFIVKEDGGYFFKFKAPVTFTAFGIGWQPDLDNYPASAFEVKYRASVNGTTWSKWYDNDGYVHPNETPTNLYWTDLLFLDNEMQHIELEVYIYPPQGLSLNYVRVSLLDMTGTEGSTEIKNKSTHHVNQIQNCPALPTISPRSTWCGSYSACHNTTSYANITATHTVVHHGASPDTYTDGATVVRGYWNYHVNTLGWSDIGYNYLFDKFGNMFQGRHNPNMPNTDVRGAHAGNANNGSIGINFLGNADVTLPTTAQLDKLKAFFAWWYDHKGLDPTTSAGMTTQAYGWQVKPRICGHKDIGQTSCPGNTLYNHLPSVRTGTKAIIDACGTTTPTGPANLQIVTTPCPIISFTCSWTNSGTGWYIQVSSASDYSNPYQKWVSGLTTYTGPTGFVLQSNGTTPLTLTYGTSYFWRIWDGNTFTPGPSFSIPFCDTIPPSTTVTTPGNWKTQDFTATFNDADNTGGSGVSRKYYQVLDFDGNHWRANAQRGFFGDNFDDIAPTVWTIPSGGGTWNSVNGTLVQSNESLNNTNIFAALDQTLSNRYLYHFTAKVEGAGHTNGRRFGFHYFCDDASLDNRGNSYFVWFRVESSKLQFYKVTNNVFTMIDEIDDIVTTIGVVYDYKVIYDRITGDHYMYRNDILIGQWKDTSPLSNNGNYISFRSGNSKLTVNEIKVYRTRGNTAAISIGNNPTKDIRYQNVSQTVPSAKIKSIVIDSAGLFSPIDFHDLNIDWSIPTDIPFVNDGLTSDIDTTSSYTQLEANWGSSADPHSDIADYWYAIGTAPGDSNTVNWTNIGNNTYFLHTNLALVFNSVYYISVKARNNAGLFSNIKTSNGQVVYNTSSALAANFIAHSNTICEGDSIMFSNQSNGATSFEWIFQGGTPPTCNTANAVITYNTAGTYNVELRVFDDLNNSDTLSLNSYIVVNPTPYANFSVIDSVIYLPNAYAYFVNNSNNANAYYWSFGDSYVSTDVSPWHNYTNSGQYSVKLVAINNLCKNDTLIKDQFIQVLDPNAINENTNDNTYSLIYNNKVPYLEINLSESTHIHIALIDLLGRYHTIIPSTFYENGTYVVSLMPSYPIAAGLYSCILSTEKGAKKIFKMLIN